MHILKPIVTSLLFCGMAACATGGVNTGDSVSRLEARRTADPNSASVNRALGIAYYKAARYPEARASLQSASKVDPTDGTTSLYLGLTAEALGDLPAAKSAYSSYMH